MKLPSHPWKTMVAMIFGLSQGALAATAADSTDLRFLSDGDGLEWQNTFIFPPAPWNAREYFYAITADHEVRVFGETFLNHREFWSLQDPFGTPELRGSNYCVFTLDAEYLSKNDAKRIFNKGDALEFGNFQILQGGGVFPKDLARTQIDFREETSTMVLVPDDTHAIRRMTCSFAPGSQRIQDLEAVFHGKAKIRASHAKIQEAHQRLIPKREAICRVGEFGSSNAPAELRYEPARRGAMKTPFYGGEDSSYAVTMNREGYEDRITVQLKRERYFYLRSSAGFSEPPKHLPAPAFPWEIPGLGGALTATISAETPEAVLSLELSDSNAVQVNCSLLPAP